MENIFPLGKVYHMYSTLRSTNGIFRIFEGGKNHENGVFEIPVKLLSILENKSFEVEILVNHNLKLTPAINPDEVSLKPNKMAKLNKLAECIFAKAQIIRVNLMFLHLGLNELYSIFYSRTF
jgi:hypothetical protein